MAFKPYPIFDLKTGMVQGRRAPWLLPQDAFEELEDCHLRRGVLEKRRGYAEFGQLVTAVYNEVADSTPNGALTDFSGTLASFPVQSPDLLMSCVIGGTWYLITPDSATPTTLESTPAGITGTINYTTGAWVLDTVAVAAVDNNTDIIAGYNIMSTDAVMGIHAYLNDGTSYGHMFDYTQLNEWVAASAQFVSRNRHVIRFREDDAPIGVAQDTLAVAGEWVEGGTSGAIGQIEAVVLDHGDPTADTGDGWLVLKNGTVRDGPFQTDEELFDESGGAGVDVFGYAAEASFDMEFTLTANTDDYFFTYTNWTNIGYFTNGIDHIHRWNGTTMTPYYVDLTTEGGYADGLDTCKFIFIVKGRIVFLSTTESATAYPRRARWMNVDDPGTAKAASFVDCPTEHEIISAKELDNEVIVFFKGALGQRSTWKIVYTGDADQAFTWQRISNSHGGAAKMSVAALPERLVGVGPVGLCQTDGRSAGMADFPIPDLILSGNNSLLAYPYNIVMEELKLSLWTFGSATATKPDTLIIYNYEENHFATYKMDAHCLGYWKDSAVLLLEDFGTEELDDMDFSWDDPAFQAGYPLVLMGQRNGKVYRINYRGDDDGSDISFQALTGRWNPFEAQGLEVSLSHIDFLCDASDKVSFQVGARLNFEETAHTTATLSCAGAEGRDKVLVRFHVDAVGEKHRIKISNDASNNRPRIHSLIPYFEPAGAMGFGDL